MKPPATKSYLEGFSVIIPPDDPRQPRAVGALRRLQEMLGGIDGRVPSTRDARESLREVERAWSRSEGIGAVPARHLRQFAWAVFQPFAREGSDLPTNGPFVTAYRAWLTENESGARLARLVAPYLRYVPEDLVLREDWRQFLAYALVRHRGRRLAIWKDRHKEFRLLDADGAERLARKIVKNPDRYEDLLTRAGLTGFLADSQFVRQAVYSLVQQVSEKLRKNATLSQDECDNLLEVFETSRGTLRFQELRGLAPEALLRPWVNQHPPEAVKQSVRAFLQRNLGNPHIRRGQWAGVSPDVRQVFLRWLAEDAIDTFFEILDGTALDRQWRERKAFWRAYLEEDMISDAWLALGSDAAALAGRISELVGGSWASLQGAAPSQSALLMRIGNITIVEWSHQGAARMWLDGDNRPPRLYESHYPASRLRAPCEDRIVHSPSLAWRGTMAEWIKKQTGMLPNHKWYQR